MGFGPMAYALALQCSTQPRSQGLFPGLEAGKDPGNEVVFYQLSYED